MISIAAIVTLLLAGAPLLAADAPGDPAGRDGTFGAGVGLCVKFDQGQPATDLPLLKELGVRWVRECEGWGGVEKVAGTYEFSPAFKERLAFYKQNGIGVIFILAYDNAVAYPPTPEDPHRNIDPQAYGRYAVGAAKLLQQAGVRFVLEIWNEPHNFVIKTLGGSFDGAPPCPWMDQYLKMATEAVKQVKAYDPTIVMLTDEDCTIIHYNMLQAGLPREVDGMAFHPYMRGKQSKPELASEGYGAKWESGFTLTDPDHSYRSMVRRLREQFQSKMGKTPQLWVTEFGCPVESDVAENVTFNLGSGSEEGVGGILVRSFIGAEAAGVKVMIWFSSWDGPDGPMGLIAKDGRKRKAYYAYQTMTAQLGDYTMVRQVAGADHLTSGVQAYLFRKGDDWKVVAWSIDGPARNLTLSGALQGAQVTDLFAGDVAIPASADGNRQLTLSTLPVYISGVKGEQQVEECFRGLTGPQ
jgi:hypothetical protein